MSWYTPRRLALVMLLPFLIGIVKEILKPAQWSWFQDFDAVSCAGVAVNTGQPIYAGGLVCPGASPTSFIYTPIVAHLAAAFEGRFGFSFFAALYGAAFCFVVAKVAAALLADDRYLAARAPFLAGLSASLLHSGNLSIIFHGIVLVARRRLAVWPLALALVVIFAGIAKPPFTVYAALLLFLDRPLWQRLALAAFAGAVPVLYVMHFRIAEPALFGQWLHLVSFYGLEAERGAGFLGLPWISSISWLPGLAMLYAVYAALMIGAGLALARLRLDSESDRLALGIAVCLLLYPRLRGYDLYTLPVGMGVAVATFRGFGRITVGHLAWAVGVTLVLFALIGGRMGTLMATTTDMVLLLGLAAVAVMERQGQRSALRQWKPQHRPEAYVRAGD